MGLARGKKCKKELLPMCERGGRAGDCGGVDKAPQRVLIGAHVRILLKANCSI